jgi:hypothetical protein
MLKNKLQKPEKHFFMSQVLRYYDSRPPNPATQVASSQTPLCAFLSCLKGRASAAFL